jgi:CBS domain-containing protein
MEDPMIVREIMTTDVATSRPGEGIAAALQTMHARNCGFAPVVNSEGTVVGVLTDRDAGLALAQHPQRPASRIAVEDAMSRPVYSCFADENLKRVLVTMATHHVRRLPVVDKHGHLQGVLSIDDIVMAPRRRGSPTAENIVDALKDICTRRPVEAIAS